MITVIFKCDICEIEVVYGNLHHGYVIPEFYDKDLCNGCRQVAIDDLKKKKTTKFRL